MNTEVEELLRDGIDRLTAGAKVPAGLAARARERQHRRRLAAWTAAATAGTVAAGTIAAVVVIAPGGHATRHHTPVAPVAPVAAGGGHAGHVTHAQTVAEVVKHASRAISAQNMIMESTFSGEVVGFEVKNGHRSVFKHRMVGYSYHGVSTGKLFDGPYGFGDGRPAAMYLQTRPKPGAKPGTLIQTTVDVTNKSWYRVVEPPVPTPSAVQLNCSKSGYLSRPSAPVGTILSTSPASLHAALACGGLKITGHGTVNGVPAIKMAGTSRLTKFKLIVDVSPKTYLPVRLVFGSVRLDYRWLQPTQANLSLLQLHIPATFRQVAPPR
jgi:hypothetical protein